MFTYHNYESSEIFSSTVVRVRTVHEKTDRTQYPSFRPQFRPTQDQIRFTVRTQNSLDYQGTHAVTGKHPLVREFFAKYMLQIGYLTYCTTDCK